MEFRVNEPTTYHKLMRHIFKEPRKFANIHTTFDFFLRVISLLISGYLPAISCSKGAEKTVLEIPQEIQYMVSTA